MLWRTLEGFACHPNVFGALLVGFEDATDDGALGADGVYNYKAVEGMGPLLITTRVLMGHVNPEGGGA